MKLTVEYLVIIDKNVSKPFYHLCDSIDGFNKLLHTNPNLIVQNNKIKYQEHYEYDYELKTNTVEGKDQRFFHIKITFVGAEDDLDVFIKLLKVIKGIVHESGGQPETLWDDVSLYFSEKAYPVIHNVENLMRKLIAYFMLTTVGKEWVIEASPSAVKEAIDKSKRKQYLDVLHQIDFIHLGDFLFKSYQTGDVNKLYEKLDQAEKLEDLDLDDLKSFVTKSNWDRYFSAIVDCDDVYK